MSERDTSEKHDIILLANYTLDATIQDIMTISIPIPIKAGTCLAYLLGKEQTLCHPQSVLGKILSQAAQREVLHDQLHHLPTCSAKRLRFSFYDLHKPHSQISFCSLVFSIAHQHTKGLFQTAFYRFLCEGKVEQLCKLYIVTTRGLI